MSGKNAYGMVIAQSFLARTFGADTLQFFNVEDSSLLIPIQGAGLLLMAFINLPSNNFMHGGA